MFKCSVVAALGKKRDALERRNIGLMLVSSFVTFVVISVLFLTVFQIFLPNQDDGELMLACMMGCVYYERTITLDLLTKENVTVDSYAEVNKKIDLAIGETHNSYCKDVCIKNYADPNAGLVVIYNVGGD